MLKLSVDKTKPYICQFCSSGYTKESTLTVHMCEQKRRHLAKDEKHVLIGYQTYVRFYQLSQQLKNTKTYEEFSKSPYYNAFVKFGSFVSNTDPLYPDKFIDWIVRSGVKLDHWCRDELYEKYVLELIHTESVETALERSLMHMQAWANDNNSLWNHYFKYVSTNRAVYDIKDGKVSPWIILNCKTGKNMLTNFRDDQLSAISSIIDPQVWVKKFKNQTFDLELVKSVVKEADL
jgi:hypothetical protein